MPQCQDHQRLNFRLATQADATPISNLINAGFRNEKTGQTWLYDDQAKRVDIITPEATSSLISGPNTVMLVGTITNETEPVACCFVKRPSDTPEPHITPGAAWFGLIAVHPKYQYRGYGLALLRYIEEFVQETWGAKRLEMDYVSSRTELRAWYGRCGFVETGAKRDFPYGEKGHEILADGLEMIVLGKDLGVIDGA